MKSIIYSGLLRFSLRQSARLIHYGLHRAIGALWVLKLLYLFCGCPFESAFAQVTPPTLEYRVVGAQLRAAPAQLAVPKDIPGSIAVDLVQGDTVNDPETLRSMAAGAHIEAVLRGEGFDRHTVYGFPGEPLRLPPIHVVGEYVVDDIRLVRTETGETVLEAHPARVEINVFPEVLVSQVTSRPLSRAEIEERGIVIDESNFRVTEFEVMFELEGVPYPVEFPVVAPHTKHPTEIVPRAELEEMLVEADRINAEITQTVQLPPDLQVPGLDLQMKPLVLQTVPQDDGTPPVAEAPAIPALVVIPGEIGFLNQFFAVQVYTANASPMGSNLSVHNLRATIELPPGADQIPGTDLDPLRMARFENNLNPGLTLPIRGVGPDGEAGTGDDVGRLQPGESGQAEFVVEGLREGLHVVDFQLEGTLDGLPGGEVTVRGRAAGSVLVRNPTFSLSFTHPRTVRAEEPYTAAVTVMNTSTTTVNMVSVSLPPASLSGAELEAGQANVVAVGDIPPGESRTAEFRLRARRTGYIKFSNLSGDNNVSGQFNLVMGIDERGVVLSPNVIQYPDYVYDLPEALRRATERVLGQAVSAASAARLPPGVRPVLPATVIKRVLELAEAGQRIRYGDDVTTTLTELALDWQGGRTESAGFDQILRETDAGREFRAALLTLVAGDDPLAALLGVESRVAGRGEAWQLSAGTGTLAPRFTRAEATATTENSPIERTLAYGIDQGHWVVAPGTDGVYEWTATGPTVGGRLNWSQTGADGLGRGLSWDLPDLPTGARLRFDPAQGNGVFVDLNADGVVDANVDGVERVVNERPPEVIAVRQDISVDALRPNPACLVPAFKNYGSIQAILFSKPMDQAAVDQPSAYSLDDPNNGVLAVRIQPGGRVALVHTRKPIGQIVPRQLTIDGLKDARGNGVAVQTIDIDPGDCSADQNDACGAHTSRGAAVAGRVLDASGQSVPGVPVTLTYYELVATAVTCEPMTVRSSQVFTDADGRFEFDYVLEGVPYSVSATDTRSLPPALLDAVSESLNEGRVDSDELVKRAREAGLSEDLVAALENDGDLGGVLAVNQTIDRAILYDQITPNRAGSTVPINLRFRGRGAVLGRVVEADGVTPVVDVAVNLFPDPSSRELGRGIYSDGEGRFAFAGVPLGPFTIDATAPDGSHRTLAGALLVPGETNEVTVVLNPEPIRRVQIAGEVVDVNGTPVPGARVAIGKISSGSMSAVALVNADSLGRWSTEVPVEQDGRYDILALSFDSRLKGERRDIDVDVDGLTFVRVTLQGTADAQVQVVYANGEPAAGATVAGGARLETTDAEGMASLTGVPTGPRQISAGIRGRADGSTGEMLDDVVRVANEGIEVVAGAQNFARIVLPSVGRITGTVFDAQGQPVGAGVKVAIPRPPVGFNWTETDADGRYVFEPITVGTYVIGAPAPKVSTDLEAAANAAVENPPSEEEIIALYGEAVKTYYGAREPEDALDGYGYNRVELLADGDTVTANIRYLPKGRIEGKVFNDRGTPIGATVTITGVARDAFGGPTTKVLGEVVSDPANGVFHFDGVLPGEFVLTATSPFFSRSVIYRSATSEIRPDRLREGCIPPGDGAGDHRTCIELRFASEESTRGRVVGRVVGPDGTPVPEGVQVRINWHRDFEIRTDAEGRFDSRIDIPIGNWQVAASDTVRVGATGLVGERRVQVRGAQECAVDGDCWTNEICHQPSNVCAAHVEVQLLGQGDVVVRVLDGDGQRVDGADVRLERGSFPAMAPLEGVTGAGQNNPGEVAFSQVFQGEWAAIGCAIEGQTRRCGRARVTLGPDGPALGVVQLTASGSISGIFLANDQTTPITDAQLNIGGIGFAVSDATGRFQLDGVRFGTHRVIGNNAVTGRYTSGLVTISDEQREGFIRLVESSLGEVAGNVVASDGTSPAIDALVTLTHADTLYPARQATTGPDGRFSFPSQPAGELSILARDTFTNRVGRNSVILEEGQAGVETTVFLEPLGDLRVRVLAADGVTPVGGVRVRAGSENADTCQAGVENCPEGTILFRELSLNQAIYLRAEVPQSQNYGLGTARLDTVGVVKDFDVVLNGVGTITGVLTRAGQPAAGVVVSAQAHGFFNDIRRDTTDENGRYTIEGLAIGRANIRAVEGALLAQDTAEIERAGQTVNVDLALTESGGLQGCLVRENNDDPVADVSTVLQFDAPSGVEGRLLAETDEQGCFDFQDAPSGAVRLVATAPELGGLFMGDFNVPARETLDVGTIRLDESVPRVLSTTPLAGDVGVQDDIVLRVEFDEGIDPVTIAPRGIYLNGPVGRVAAQLNLVDDEDGVARILLVTPTAPLASETYYELVVAAGQNLSAGLGVNDGPRDRVGNPLAQSTVIGFTVRDTIAPELLSMTPGNGAVQVDPSQVIRLSFNEAIASGPLQISVTNGLGRDVPGRVDVGIGQQVVVFTPSTGLLPNQRYTVVVDQVVDLAGNPAADQPYRMIFDSVDSLGPAIVGLTLLGGGGCPPDMGVVTGCAPAGTLPRIQVQLSEPEDGVSIQGQILETADILPSVEGLETLLPVLPAGRLTVVVNAVDRFGNVGAPFQGVVVGVPNTPPVFGWTVSENAATGGTLPVRISAVDDSAVTQLSLVAGGAAAADLAVPGGGPIEVLLPIDADLGPGQQVILTATAVDDSGAESQEVRRIDVVDRTPPSGEVVIEGDVQAGAVLRVRVNGNDAFGVARITMSVGGVLSLDLERVFVAPIPGQVSHTFDVQLPPIEALPSGGNLDFAVTVFDTAGNSADVMAQRAIPDTVPPRIVARFPTGDNADGESLWVVPYIEFSEPVADQVLNGGMLRVMDAEGNEVPTVAERGEATPDDANRVYLRRPSQSAQNVIVGLESNATYTIAIAAGVADAAGNGLVDEQGAAVDTVQWDFTTWDVRLNVPLPLVDGEVVFIEGDRATFSIDGLELFGDQAGSYSYAAVWWANPLNFLGVDNPTRRVLPTLDETPDGILVMETTLGFAGGTNVIVDRQTIRLQSTDADADGDGLPNGLEDTLGLNLRDPIDADGDLDADGLSNVVEFQQGTQLDNPDTDGDGVSDGLDLNPLSPTRPPFSGQCWPVERPGNSFSSNQCVFLGPDGFSLTEQFTFELAVRPDATDSRTGVVFKSGEPAGLEVLYTRDEGASSLSVRLTPQVGDTRMLTLPVNLEDNQFHHLIVTYDGQQVALYLGGRLIVLEDLPGGLVNDGGRFVLGGQCENDVCDALSGTGLALDSMRFWDRALGAQSVPFMFLRSFDVADGVQAFWPVDAFRPTDDRLVDTVGGLNLESRCIQPENGNPAPYRVGLNHPHCYPEYADQFHLIDSLVTLKGQAMDSGGGAGPVEYVITMLPAFGAVYDHVLREYVEDVPFVLGSSRFFYRPDFANAEDVSIDYTLRQDGLTALSARVSLDRPQCGDGQVEQDEQCEVNALRNELECDSFCTGARFTVDERISLQKYPPERSGVPQNEFDDVRFSYVTSGDLLVGSWPPSNIRFETQCNDAVRFSLYQLVGGDEVEVGGVDAGRACPSMRYTNIPAGDYSLRVSGSDGQALWQGTYQWAVQFLSGDVTQGGVIPEVRGGRGTTYFTITLDEPARYMFTQNIANPSGCIESYMLDESFTVAKTRLGCMQFGENGRLFLDFEAGTHQLYAVVYDRGLVVKRDGGVCGDGIVNVGEDCDDGDTQAGDGCSADCLNE